MHVTLISGSHRSNSQTSRVAHYLSRRLSQLRTGVASDIIDLAANPLPLWDERAWQPDSELQQLWKPYSDKLKQAEGLVILSPEWSGMVPAGLKNFLLYTSSNEVGHKPALIVGVSASRGGSHPVDELRISGYKNNHIAYIPEHLIVRDVADLFVNDVPSGKDDEYMRERADFALINLLEYTQALKSVREKGLVFNKKFPFGM